MSTELKGNTMRFGIFVNFERPKSKKAVREAVATDPSSVHIECTSLFVNDYDYDGPVDEAPPGCYSFVGPDPYCERRFYGTITVRGGKATVS
jgi:hypothetical protein